MNILAIESSLIIKFIIDPGRDLVLRGFLILNLTTIWLYIPYWYGTHNPLLGIMIEDMLLHFFKEGGLKVSVVNKVQFDTFSYSVGMLPFL